MTTTDRAIPAFSKSFQDEKMTGIDTHGMPRNIIAGRRVHVSLHDAAPTTMMPRAIIHAAKMPLLRSASCRRGQRSESIIAGLQPVAGLEHEARRRCATQPRHYRRPRLLLAYYRRHVAFVCGYFYRPSGEYFPCAHRRHFCATRRTPQRQEAPTTPLRRLAARCCRRRSHR